MKSLIKKEVLKLDTRNKIFNLIVKNPGICIRELERVSGFAIGELTYHIPILLDSNLINEENDGYFRRFFSSELNSKDREVISALSRDAVRKFVPLFLKKNKLTNKEMCSSLSISASTINWHINRMKKIGLMYEIREKNKTFYLLNEKDTIKKIYLL